MDIFSLAAAQTEPSSIADIQAAWATGVGAGIGALLVVVVRVLRSLGVSRLLPPPWAGVTATVLAGLATVGATLAAGAELGAVLSAATTALVVPLAGLLVRSDSEEQ